MKVKHPLRNTLLQHIAPETVNDDQPAIRLLQQAEFGLTPESLSKTKWLGNPWVIFEVIAVLMSVDE
jgi:hypothetical protein